MFIYYIHKFTFQWNHINIRTSTTFHFILIQFHSIHVVCFWQLFKLFFLCFLFVCLMFALFSFCSFLYQHKILFCIWKTCIFQKLVCFKQENRKFQSKINKEVLICCWWSMLLNGLKGAFRQGLGALNYPLGLTAAKSMKAKQSSSKMKHITMLFNSIITEHLAFNHWIGFNIRKEMF